MLLVALMPTSCAMNDVGIRLHKKPDLSAVTPGTPLNKVRGLSKPIKREVITKGELQGAEMRLYEWDLKDDDVNNRMFTSVVVKDGVILGWYEDTPAKWQKDPQLHKMAKLESAFENLAKAQANYAATQAAIGAAGAYMANRASYNPMQYYNMAYNQMPPIQTSTRLANVYGARGELAGSVNRRGQLLDSRGELAGSINSRGQILDARGDLAGSVTESGQILNSRGDLSGSVRE
jgi:hypothetical protein